MFQQFSKQWQVLLVVHLVIVERWRVALPVDGGFVNNPVDLVRRDSHADGLKRFIEDLAPQFASNSEIFERKEEEILTLP